MRNWWIVFITDWKIAAHRGELLRRFRNLALMLMVLALIVVAFTQPAWQTLGTHTCGEVSARIVAQHRLVGRLNGVRMRYTAEDADGQMYYFGYMGGELEVDAGVLVQRRCNANGSVRRNPIRVTSA